MIPGGVNPMLLSAGGSSGYQLQRSLRLRAGASAYLSRTLGTPTNGLRWTWSAWVKRGALANTGLLDGFVGGANFTTLAFSNNSLLFYNYVSSAERANLATSALFRDPSAWYHIVCAYDSANATDADRFIIHVNGIRQTLITTTAVTINDASYINSAGNSNRLGLRSDASWYFDGYLSDVHFIDGQALTPSAFGQFDSNGMWQAKPYTGTYGTNGFKLDFNDPTSTTTLMLDRSGNGNNWTANNISLTAGATYDSMLDVPLGGGGGERGNYATWNPLNNNGSTGAPTDGNLKGFGDSGTSYWRGPLSTFPVDASGNWWAEFTLSFGGSSGAVIGIIPPLSVTGTSADTPIQSGALSYRDNGVKIQGPGSIVGSAYGASYTTNDVIGVHLNAGVLTFYKQTAGAGAFVSQGSAFTGLSGLYHFFIGMYGSSGNFWNANFGQRPFNNTSLPTGAKAIHTGNLPASAIPNPKLHFDAVTWTGNNVNGRQITGLQFGPELVWPKARSAAYDALIHDAVRGVGKSLIPSSTGAETTNSGNGYIGAFNSDGFTLTQGGSGIVSVNESGIAYAAWLWKAGGAAVTNNAGSISAQVSANPSAGFSIVTYTGTGANATVGHGLGVTPAMIIVKCRTNGTPNWRVWHRSLGATDSYLGLNQTAAVATSTTIFNSQSSTTFGVGSDSSTNGVQNYVAYCFAEIPGFSKIGSYTGNGSADGPFVHCGFRPRWLMVKRSDTAQDWVIIDTARDTHNVTGNYVFPNGSSAENGGSARSTSTDLDVTANGFKLRNNASSSGYTNANGGTYIFIAFAEAPFQSSLAR